MGSAPRKDPGADDVACRKGKRFGRGAIQAEPAGGRGRSVTDTGGGGTSGGGDVGGNGPNAARRGGRAF